LYDVREAGSVRTSFSQNVVYLQKDENTGGNADCESPDARFTDVDTIREFEFVFHVVFRLA